MTVGMVNYSTSLRGFEDQPLHEYEINDDVGTVSSVFMVYAEREYTAANAFISLGFYLGVPCKNGCRADINTRYKCNGVCDNVFAVTM